jgi:hypothetical protein
MRCPKGTQLEKDHDRALRVYLQAAAAVKLSAPDKELSRGAMDKAPPVQVAYDEMSAHFSACSICQAAEEQTHGAGSFTQTGESPRKR